MKRLGYYAFLLLINVFRLIPFGLIYLFSDFLALVFYYIVPYRKKMILENLSRTFPDKNEREIKKICREFYRNLSDILLEAIKGFTLTEKQIARRYQFDEDDRLNQYYKSGQSVVATTAHLANWEWGAYATGFTLEHKIIGVYKKMSQPYINQYVIRSRSKFDVMLSEMKETTDIVKNYSHKRPFILTLIADQRPSDPYKAYWTTFLGRDTAFFFGPEKFAREYNLPVFFFNIHRVKRGHYHVAYDWLSEPDEKLEKGVIIERYKNVLEREILHRPSEWLWSHSRWKHPKPADFDGKAIRD